MRLSATLLLISIVVSGRQAAGIKETYLPQADVSLVILGTVQDAGSPQIGCKKNCCKDLFIHPDQKRKVVCLGLMDKKYNHTYLFEATPDIATQLNNLNEYSVDQKDTPDGIFLTHAHIGHYTGLMYLGKEAMNATNVSVYMMPRMKTFLEQNGPWSQLINNKNILSNPLKADEEVELSPSLKITPFMVPHRDEFSETVGYRIAGPNKTAVFIPDIDKWEKWNKSIIDVIARADYVFIDGTFYDADEINNRDISQIPHPFVIESMKLFSNLAPAEKKKIYFIHFNHTNPLLNKKSEQAAEVIRNGFNIASYNDVFTL